jgi:hypothetical protein
MLLAVSIIFLENTSKQEEVKSEPFPRLQREEEEKKTHSKECETLREKQKAGK